MANTHELAQDEEDIETKKGQTMVFRTLAALALFAGHAQAEPRMPMTDWSELSGGLRGVIGHAAQPIICNDGTARRYSLTVQCFGPNMSVKLTDTCDMAHKMFVVPARRSERSRMPNEVDDLTFETLMGSLTLLVSASQDASIPQSVIFDLRSFPLAIYANRSQCQL